MKIINWTRDLDPESEVTMPPKVQQAPVNTLEFSWDSPNLHETFQGISHLSLDQRTLKEPQR